MSLKELTKEKHHQAENTRFMRAVFDKTLPIDLWYDFTYQKYIWYGAIEYAAESAGLLKTLPGIERAGHLTNDYIDILQLAPIGTYYSYREPAKDYTSYIRTLSDPKQILAHLYTWHMGDLFGGQMIKQIIDAPHSHLDFDNPRELMTAMRDMLTDDLADEANVAFDWAIRILQEYDSTLE